MQKIESLFYSGRSMAGTFREGDRLEIEKSRINDIKIGDVTVFISPMKTDEEARCVHRVVFSTEKGIITRGDNNEKDDDGTVTEENFVGRVTHYERNGEIHKVANGWLGLGRARVLRGRLHMIKAMKLFLRKPYRMLKRTGIISTLWRPKIEAIHFETRDGPLVKYVHKGKTVAGYWIKTNRWWFKRPYDFVIGPKVKK
ncbi:MAG: S26 family signal peptidase [Candidatus Aminicenantes bacterium]|nr:S26 family signal peptidase [Candidatus Aminicenantes bacterium]